MNSHSTREAKPSHPALKTVLHNLVLLINLFWLLSPGVRVGAQGEPEARLLDLGKPVERELAGGQSHSYQITLARSQCLSVIVEQRGIDVVARLMGPDGKQIAEFDSEIRKRGQEVVSHVAETAGIFRLNVHAKKKGSSEGSYEIRAVELRDATEKDWALQEARKLFTESSSLNSAGKYDEARPLAERALEIREKTLGPEHSDVAASLNSLANIYRRKGDYAKAEPIYQRALDIRVKALGPEHPDVAISLHTFANLHSAKGDLAKAEQLYQRALDIREKALGPEHSEVAISLGHLAVLHSAKGDYDKAEPLFQRSLAIAEKTLGPEHSDLAHTLTGLAVLYYTKGDYAKAEPLYQRAMAIWVKALGPEHPYVAFPLNNLAILHSEQGDYAKAEPLYQRALVIMEKAFGPGHPEVAQALINLAIIHYLKSDYDKAEPLFQRALVILEKALGPVDPRVANCLDNLANIYSGKGDYVKARPLRQRALDIQEKANGPEHIDVAFSLHNSANLYCDMGDYANAEPLYQRSLAIREKKLGPEHSDVAYSLTGLANLYRDRGDYAKAEQLYGRALDIWKKAFGPEHRQVALSLHNLANLYRDIGDYAKAEPLYQRSLDIWEKTIGPQHPDVATCLHNLARLYAAKGALAQAITFQLRASAVSERNIAIKIATGSERQKLAYLATLTAQADQTISLHVRIAPNDPAARNLAATTILQRKGRVLDTTSDSLGALRRRFDPEDQALLDRFRETNARLARLVLGGLQRISPAERQKQIKDLEERKEELESVISRHSAEFRAQSQAVTLDSVKSAIPENAALIEFSGYRPFNAKYAKPDEQFGQPRYVAYVLRRQGEPQWVELGEAKTIDNVVAMWRQALRNPRRGDVRRLARQVDERVMRPVRALLGETSRVLISADGSLNLIPFAALVDEHGRFLVERYSLSHLSSGRDLLRLQAKLPCKPEPVIVADPDFGEWDSASLARRRDVEIRPDPQQYATQRIGLDRVYFTRLPASAGEARALKSILPQSTVLIREHATEAALKQLSSPRILHIATHGFFLEDTWIKLANTRDVVLLGDGPAGFSGAQLENPLLRSGLALAGANLRRSGPNQEDDGVLTAMEVAGLDLWGTKLVALSACDTGVGEVKNGEGVYGLRRALALAGSETQVISLWPVSDVGARDLMIEYYKALKRGEGRAEALRQVQLRMLKRKDRAHPFYWASFIQSGEWANLDGKR
jgi:CHAT domain-containing protein/Tfp pilus assembly protein PilF